MERATRRAECLPVAAQERVTCVTVDSDNCALAGRVPRRSDNAPPRPVRSHKQNAYECEQHGRICFSVLSELTPMELAAPDMEEESDPRGEQQIENQVRPVPPKHGGTGTGHSRVSHRAVTTPARRW